MKPIFLTALLLFSWVAAAHAENPGVVEIDHPGAFRQIVALSDVHGMYDPARILLRAAHVLDNADHWVGDKTLLIVTGDSIDKGPDSIQVLRLWIRLQAEAPAKGGRVVVLLGNHEAEFLHDPQGAKAAMLRSEAEAMHLPLTDLTDPAKPLGHFLHDLPLAARVGKWLFCHAGWPPDEAWSAFRLQVKTDLNQNQYGDPLLLASDSILEKKSGASGKRWWKSKKEVAELERRLTADGLYGVVFGHQPGGLDITDNVGVTADGRIFKIDSGMAPVTSDEKGNGTGAQPYAGHVLVFTAPGELEHDGPIRYALSLDAQGKSTPVPVAPK